MHQPVCSSAIHCVEHNGNTTDLMDERGLFTSLYGKLRTVDFHVILNRTQWSEESPSFFVILRMTKSQFAVGSIMTRKQNDTKKVPTTNKLSWQFN